MGRSRSRSRDRDDRRRDDRDRRERYDEGSGRDRGGRDRRDDRERNRDRDRDRDRDRGEREDEGKSRKREREATAANDESSSGGGGGGGDGLATDKMKAAGFDPATGKSLSTSQINYEALKATVNVTESNGEVSCSVEDTNKLRAALGLKPLRENKVEGEEKSEEQLAVENQQAKDAEAAKDRELAEIQVRLEKARKKRLLKEKVKGETIATSSESTHALSAADWVKQSRKIAKSKVHEDKLLAEKRARMLEEQEDAYTSKDLKGLKIAHGADEFQEGEVILTLKDTSVLAGGDENGVAVGLNEDDDELVNVNMVDDQRRNHLKKVKQRARQPVYSATDDSEFEIDPNTGKPMDKSRLLTHYDEIEETNKEIVLDDTGAIAAPEVKPGEELADPDLPVSLRVGGGNKVASDYYTNDEMAAFKKPKKKKKKTGMRKKDRVAELEAAMAADGGAGEADGGDHGSRKERTSGGLKDEMNASLAAKKAAFDVAKNQHQTKVTAAFAEEKAAPTVTEAAEPSYEEDNELAVALARSRRLAQLKKSAAKKANIAAMVKASKPKQEMEEDAGAEARGDKMDLEDLPTTTSTDAASAIAKDDGKIVFSSTTEFSTRLMATLTDRADKRKERQDREKTEADASSAAETSGASNNAGDDAMDVEGTSENSGAWGEGDAGESRGGSGGGKREDGQQVDGEDEEELDEDTQGAIEQYSDKQMAFMHRQPLVSGGMAATLGLLKSAGDLSSQKKEEIMVGRAKDVRKSERGDGRDEDGVKIEYRDSDGRLLTTKEAFRQLSYKFHGHGPGQKKKEKRRKEVIDMEKTLMDTQKFGTAANLQKAQLATGKAYIPLSGMSAGASMGSTFADDDEFDLEKKSAKKKKKSFNVK